MWTSARPQWLRLQRQTGASLIRGPTVRVGCFITGQTWAVYMVSAGAQEGLGEEKWPPFFSGPDDPQAYFLVITWLNYYN